LRAACDRKRKNRADDQDLSGHQRSHPYATQALPNHSNIYQA
jgi:hypothetical protein